MQITRNDIRGWLWVAALLIVLQAWPAEAQEATPDTPQAGSLLWRMGQGYATATTLDTAVTMKISGLVARVSVRQQFRNEGAEWTERNNFV